MDCESNRVVASREGVSCFVFTDDCLPSPFQRSEPGPFGDPCSAFADVDLPSCGELCHELSLEEPLDDDCAWLVPELPPSVPFDPDEVKVELSAASGQAVPLSARQDATTCDLDEGGWYFDDPAAPTAIVACDATCEVLQANDGLTLTMKLACVDPPIPF
jgi:hypothetical protein